MRVMILGSLIAVLCCSCGGDDGGGGVDAGVDGSNVAWLDGYSFRKEVTVALPELTETITDFPLSVRLTADADLLAAALENADEIAFTTDDAETPLPFEIEAFDAATGTLTAWVTPAELADGMTFYVYYGGATTVTADVDATWSAPYASVWHISGDPAGTAPQFPDSAGPNDGTTSAGASITTHVGVSGNAIGTNAVNDQIVIGDPADGSLDFGMSSFSYSVWVNAQPGLNDADQPMWKGGTSTQNVGYTMLLGTGQWIMAVNDGNASRTAQFSPTEILNEWVHLVAVVDRDTDQLRAYINGALSLSATAVRDIPGYGSLDTDKGFVIGGEGSRYNGIIDEVRIYTGALSEDRIALEFANLDPTAGMLTIAEQETAP